MLGADRGPDCRVPKVQYLDRASGVNVGRAACVGCENPSRFAGRNSADTAAGVIRALRRRLLSGEHRGWKSGRIWSNIFAACVPNSRSKPLAWRTLSAWCSSETPRRCCVGCTVVLKRLHSPQEGTAIPDNRGVDAPGAELRPEHPAWFFLTQFRLLYLCVVVIHSNEKRNCDCDFHRSYFRIKTSRGFFWKISVFHLILYGLLFLVV